MSLLLSGVVIVVCSWSCWGKVCSSVRLFVSSVAASVSVCRASTGTASAMVDSSMDTSASSASMGVCCVIVSSEFGVVDSSGVIWGGSVLIGFFVLGLWLYPAIMKIMPSIVEKDIQNMLFSSVNMNEDAMANTK